MIVHIVQITIVLLTYYIGHNHIYYNSIIEVTLATLYVYTDEQTPLLIKYHGATVCMMTAVNTLY